MRLDQVWVRPLSSQSAARWARRISADCPDLRPEAWREGTNYHVFSPTRDCLLSHHPSLRELQLFKISLSGVGERHLWLGDLPTTPGLYFLWSLQPANSSSPKVKERDTDPPPTRASPSSSMKRLRLTWRSPGGFIRPVRPPRQHSGSACSPSCPSLGDCWPGGGRAGGARSGQARSSSPGSSVSRLTTAGGPSSATSLTRIAPGRSSPSPSQVNISGLGGLAGSRGPQTSTSC